MGKSFRAAKILMWVHVAKCRPVPSRLSSPGVRTAGMRTAGSDPWIRWAASAARGGVALRGVWCARDAVPAVGPLADAVHHEVGEGRRLRRRSEEHTSELQSRQYLVCRLL